MAVADPCVAILGSKAWRRLHPRRNPASSTRQATSTSSSSAPGSPGSAPRTTCGSGSRTGRFVILEAQDNRGGTWWTHRYPGVRSDSDLFTYGYRFKPWRGPSIAAGEEILDYLDEVIDEDDLEQHIRYHHRVTAASWSDATDRRWTVEVTRADTGERLRFTTDFLWMCQGYYNHAKPYQPQLGGHGPVPGRARAPAAVARRTSTSPASASS